MYLRSVSSPQIKKITDSHFKKPEIHTHTHTYTHTLFCGYWTKDCIFLKFVFEELIFL